MKAVILAGGFGTRLRPLTYTKPKPMLPIAQKPILYYIVESLASQGFDEIIITTNYLDKQVREYFGDGSDYGLRIVYSSEKRPLGTAGGVRRAKKYLNECFAVIQGDNITEINFKEELVYHISKGGIGTLAVKKLERPWRFGIVKLDRNNKIMKFAEKPTPEACFSDLVSVGLYILEPEVLDFIPAGIKYDFARDLFPELLQRGLPIYGYETSAFWVDVGHIDGYLEATKWILKKIRRHISDTAEVKDVTVNGAVWIDDEVRIKPGTKIVGPVTIEYGSTICASTYIGPDTVVKNDVEVGAKSRLEGAIIYEKSALNSETALKKCIIAEECKIGNRVKIDEGAVVGARCKIGDGTYIHKESKIWPNVKINPGSKINGIIKWTEDWI